MLKKIRSNLLALKNLQAERAQQQKKKKNTTTKKKKNESVLDRLKDVFDPRPSKTNKKTETKKKETSSKKETPKQTTSSKKTETKKTETKPQEKYTQKKADREAAALYGAMKGGVTGWGTDEKKVFKTLEGKSPKQVEMIRKSYKDHYGKDLDKVVRSEMSGSDWKQAEALLKSEGAKSDAVKIKKEIDGVFGSGKDALRVLEDKSPDERRAIAEEYAALHGGAGKKSPEDFMLDRLSKELNRDGRSRAKNLLGASKAKTPKEQAAHETAALKSGLREDVDGLGTDEERIFERLEKASPEQRDAVVKDPKLMKALEKDLSKEDMARVRGMLDGDAAKADAAQIRGAVNGFFGANEDGVRAVLEGKTPEQIDAIKAAYKKQTGKSLEAEVRGWKGSEADVTLRLLKPPAEGDAEAQAEASAEKLHLAMDGLGTDEEAIRAELAGKSKPELDQVAAAYKQKYGKDLRTKLDSELDGRDELELLKQDYDLGAIDPNDPKASAERLRRIREQKEAEAGFGSWALDKIQTVVKGEGQSDLDRLDRNLGRAEKAIQSGNTERAEKLTGYADDDVESLQSSKDSLADAAATTAVVVTTTAAVVLTGGAATPLALAGYAALGAGTRAGTYHAFQGDAAGGQELFRQSAIGLVEGGTAVIPVKGTAAFNGGFKQAAIQGVKEGAVGGTSGGVADASTRSETWSNGFVNGLNTVAQKGAIDGTLGAFTGGLVSGGLSKGIDAFRPGEIPVSRNTALTGNTTHVRYDGGKVRIEAGPQATEADIAAHLETARILQRYEGPLGQMRQLKDRIRQNLTSTPGYGTQGFESRLEVQKLRGIVGDLETAQAKLDTHIGAVTGRQGPATVAERQVLAREIAHVETQLRAHTRQVDSLAPGRGVVAKEGFREVEVQTSSIGEGLESFVEKLRGPDGAPIAQGGVFRVTAPEVQGKNNLASAQSVDLVLDPNNLYVRSLRVGDTELPLRVNKDGVLEERYPSGPRTILRPDEVDALLRNLHAYVKNGGKDVSVTYPPKGLEKLPDLIAMVAEGSRFPAIREQIQALEAGRLDGHPDFEEHALREADEEWRGLDVDPERTLPVHYIKNWEDRFKEGNATFGLPGWTRPS